MDSLYSDSPIWRQLVTTVTSEGPTLRLHRHGWEAGTAPACPSSRAWELFLSLFIVPFVDVISLCFTCVLITQQLGTPTHLQNQKLCFASYVRGCALTVGSKRRSHRPQQCQDVGRWAMTLSSLTLFCSPYMCNLCLQVGATASGDEISCAIQTLPVKFKSLKAHRRCVCSATAVFSLAQHYPSALTDTSSVWLLQIMETRNKHLPGMIPTRQALFRLPSLYPPTVCTGPDTRRQSMWEVNIKASACCGAFLRPCHLRSGLDSLVPKLLCFHRAGFIQSGDFV